MTLVRINALDTGRGYDIQINAGTNADLLVRSNQGGQWIRRIAAEGVQSAVAATLPSGNYAIGGIQHLSGRGLSDLYRNLCRAGARDHAADLGCGWQGDALSGTGYIVRPTVGGGFALVPLVIALTGSGTINGATTQRRADNQRIRDSETPQCGGFHTKNTITVQVSSEVSGLRSVMATT